MSGAKIIGYCLLKRCSIHTRDKPFDYSQPTCGMSKLNLLQAREIKDPHRPTRFVTLPLYENFKQRSTRKKRRELKMIDQADLLVIPQFTTLPFLF